ncbi:hypothetical protein [Paraliomyxa miuraensis]|uniref:hypothetical protein n=1 Tax=Paraliomyxa miuraensis TaxID=376150 RepID=UPI002257425C|nr:hypothetical protein [Paraliomyxa miuraensis]MCX4240072.1 hypothetical protein [Paraliomyxa miuraensis]
MNARDALLHAASSYLRAHPEELTRILRNALGLRFGVPIAGLRWLAGQAGDGGPKDVVIEPCPPGISVAATVELMGTMVRAQTKIYIDRILMSAEELRLEVRLEGTTMTVLGDAESPVAALIKSGALDLTKSGNLAAHLPGLSRLLGESTGNRLVIDLMKHPAIGKNRVARRVLGLVSSVVTVHGVESDDGHLDVLLRAFPRGMGGAARAVRDHLFTDGPPWIRGMLPGRSNSSSSEPRRGY